MKRAFFVSMLLLTNGIFPARAAGVATIAGIFSIAASSGTIIRESHDLIRHPLKTLKHHGKQIKEAAKGKK
jgi:hypothetical protein